MKRVMPSDKPSISHRAGHVASPAVGSALYMPVNAMATVIAHVLPVFGAADMAMAIGKPLPRPDSPSQNFRQCKPMIACTRTHWAWTTFVVGEPVSTA